MSLEGASGHIRIGELSRRVGVSVELLRAWERRYDLLTPSRTPGGLRLYTAADERCVGRMREHLATGVSAAEAARLTLRELRMEGVSPVADDPTLDPGAPPPGVVGHELWEALDRLDETAANVALDLLLARFTLETAVRDAVLPYMRGLGDRWQDDGAAVIAREHFASAFFRGRLLGLARGWGGGRGPMALLACFPGDQHDLGLVCFGLGLRRQGWRITFLGPDTPLATLGETARLLGPAMIVLTATVRPSRAALGEDLAAIAAGAPLLLAGAGVNEGDASAVGAVFLTEDPFTAATRIAAEASAPGVSS